MRRLVVLMIALTLTASLCAVPPSGAQGPDATHEMFKASDFSSGGTINNKWNPLAPGTVFVLEGSADRGEGVVVHRVTFTVTDLTKVINGVRTRVLYDVDVSNDVLAEAELAFHAQDNNFNVWLLGEYPEEFADGAFEGAPSTWISGVSDAQPGIMMRENPRAGSSAYLQGVIPSIQFRDLAEVVGFEKRVCVRVGCFKDVLVIRETNTYHPDEGFQLKYYATGVGNIRVDFVGGAEQETLELVEMRRLGAGELAEAREAALRLDQRAYLEAPAIYGDTPRADRDKPCTRR